MVPNTVFIVPYRNRLPHKIHFDIYMKYILEDLPPDSYKIFYAHQCDERPFNRGAMKNIGFLAVKRLYPDHYKDINFVFNDVDTVPSKKNLLNYNTTHGQIKHYYGFDFALGGIFSIKGADFEKCRGFPNMWGWGFEDNCIQKRVLEAGLHIDRSNFFKVCDNNIIHIIDSFVRRMIKDDKQKAQTTPDCLHTIRNIKYEIVDEFINISNFSTSYNCVDEVYWKKNMLNKNKHPFEKLPKSNSSLGMNLNINQKINQRISPNNYIRNLDKYSKGLGFGINSKYNGVHNWKIS